MELERIEKLKISKDKKVLKGKVQKNHKSRNYWKWLKDRLKKEGSELVSDTNQLKILTI